MTFENLSFYEFAIFFPKPDYNENNVVGVVVYKGNEFPSLKNQYKTKNTEGDKISIGSDHKYILITL